MPLFTLSEQDKDHPDNQKLKGSADFKGPVESRRCTDPLFALLLLGVWGLTSWVGYYAVQNGNVKLLTHGYDWNGEVCKKYFYPVNMHTMGVCVDECPSESDYTKYYCIGNTACPGSQPCAINNPITADNNIANGQGVCMFQIASKPVLNRCVVQNITAIAQFGLATNGFNPKYITQFYADILEARAYIFGIGFGIAVILGFLWTFSLRIPGLVFTMVWVICFLVLGFFGLLGALMYHFADQWKAATPPTHSKREIQGAKGLAFFLFACAGLWFCMLIFLRTRINLAIGLVKEAARAVCAMPIMIFYPILQAAGFVTFLVPWAFYSIFVSSMGKFEEESYSSTLGLFTTVNVQRFQYASGAEKYAWFLLFVLFWTGNFIVAVGQITQALAVSRWYFTRDRGAITSGTFVHSACQATFWHMGTAAFGSLIIAIIEFIRAIIAYFQKKAKETKNKLLEYLLCCVQCCMWCMEKCMKFINKNAYIQTAIFGVSFCTAAKKAFFLIARNFLRIGAVTVVSEFVIIVGKVFIVLLSGGLSYFAMEKVLGDELNSPIGPTILVMILAWFTADMFCEIFSMATDTLLQCFVADEEMFEPGERFGSPEITNYIDKHGKADIAASPEPGDKAVATVI